jgi:GDP-L-fucose synthase
MKILLTGGTGMCGRNILEHSSAANFQILSPKSNELNLLDIAQIKVYLSENKPDLIIHTAGLVAGIQFNIKNPTRALIDNSYIGLNLISAASEIGIPRLINLGSSCMYPRFGKNPLAESQILQGELEPTNEGYALAKILSTRLCEYINRENTHLSYKTLIPCNLFGRYDTFSLEFSHMIPAAIEKVHSALSSNSNSVEIWGDGEARREFMSVSDLADLVFYCIDNYDSMPQNLNAGLGHDYSINEYYSAVAAVIGYQGEFFHDTSKPVGMKQKLVDVQRLRSFGWQHQMSLQGGLKQAYEYFLEIKSKPNLSSRAKDAFI